MANLQKGEVSLPVGDAIYTLSFSVNAFCHLEEVYDGRPFKELAQELSNPDKVSMTMLRNFVHAALLDHHPEVDIRETGRIITQAGGLEVMMTKVVEGLTASMPPAKGKRGSRPPKPGEDGTGPAS